jgi:hypothetical protein
MGKIDLRQFSCVSHAQRRWMIRCRKEAPTPERRVRAELITEKVIATQEPYREVQRGYSPPWPDREDACCTWMIRANVNEPDSTER